MCQAKVLLDGNEIMRDVLFVESDSTGVRLMALFEPVQEVPARIRKIDFMKNQILLETITEMEKSNEGTGKVTGIDTPLDRA